MSDQTAPLDSQVARLGEWIAHNVAGEPSRSEGAVDTAIRVMDDLLHRVAETAWSGAPDVTAGPPPVPYAEHEAEMMRLLAELERRSDLLDNFALLLGGEAVGEHSSENDPWANALRPWTYVLRHREFSRGGLSAELTAAYSKTEPLLGLATTRDLLVELEGRLRITQNSTAGRELGSMCKAAIDNLAPSVLGYRTAGHHTYPIPSEPGVPTDPDIVLTDAPTQSKAPWTADIVVALAAWQDCPWVHPYTCGNDHEGERILVATTDGWVCTVCDYTQDWCWIGMLDGPPPNPFPDGPTAAAANRELT